MDRLSAFMGLLIHRPFVWGFRDCVTVPADWVLSCTGKDPAADLRLTYDDAASCQRATRFFSDPLAVVGPRMQACGLAHTDDFARGDVGLIRLAAEDGTGAHGAICLGGIHWAAKKMDRGIVVIERPEIIAGWRVPA